MPDRSIAGIEEVAERAREVQSRLLKVYLPGEITKQLGSFAALEVVLDEAFSSAVYYRVAAAVREAWAAATAGMKEPVRNAWAACLLAGLIAKAPRRLSRFPMPDSILPHTTHQFARILDELEKDPESLRTLESDLYLKDLGLCRLDVFPCVAQIVDKHAGIPRKVILRSCFRATSALAGLGLSTGFRYRPFLEIHTHIPMLKGFTPEGWDMCYVLVADLLRLYPEYAGLVGWSWFYDPQLERVSPRLSYLRARPLSGQAFLLPVGQRPADIANATATSESRRQLYQQGKYLPACWGMIWPRKPMLDWVDAHRDAIQRNALSFA